MSPVATSGGGLNDVTVEGKAASGLTLAHCTFTSPLAPHGPRVVVRRALVDSGSSDCELRGNLLERLPRLPVVSRGAVYETATGGEAFDAYEVLLTVEGRTAAVVVTACFDGSSDDALVGHMALGALRLPLDCQARRLLRVEDLPKAVAGPQDGGGGLRAPALDSGTLRTVGPIQSARFGCLHAWGGESVDPMEVDHADWEEDALPTSMDALPSSMADSRPYAEPSAPAPGGYIPPRWVKHTSCAVAIEGLRTASAPSNGSVACVGENAPMAKLGRAIIPVTYVRCVFRSPLAPHGASVVVEQALVDTGSADCELREGFLQRLWPLPAVGRGVVYETVSGRVVHDSYEVLLTVEGRTCAAVACTAPEERFAEDASDPNSDEAVVGFAALAALGLIVDCSARRVLPRGDWPPGA